MKHIRREWYKQHVSPANINYPYSIDIGLRIDYISQILALSNNQQGHLYRQKYIKVACYMCVIGPAEDCIGQQYSVFSENKLGTLY